MEPNPVQPEEAVARFKAGCSCSQAVLSVFAEPLGIERAAALKIASGFGGGMGRQGDTCGAVTGAIMVLGLRHGTANIPDRQTKERVYEKVRELTARFKAAHGSTTCRDLLGCDISTPAGFQAAHEQQLIATRCPQFVQTAVQIVNGLL